MKLFLQVIVILVLGVQAFALNVCGLTVNSPDEFEVFKKAVPEANTFEFFDLSNRFVNPQTGRMDQGRWMNDVCQRGISCDVVIISGHFTGINSTGFSRENNNSHELDVDTLMKSSCSQNCQGLFQKTKEVYLMGCYTGKTINVAGFDLANFYSRSKEITSIPSLVPVRYTNEERFRQVFPNAARIYGYPLEGLLGRQVRDAFYNHILKNRKYFLDLENKDADDLYRLSHDRSMRMSLLTQNAGNNYREEFRQEGAKVCQMEVGSSKNKMKAAIDLLLQPNGLKHVDAVLGKISKGQISVDELGELETSVIQKLQKRISQWLNLRQNSVSISIQLIELSRRLGFISSPRAQETLFNFYTDWMKDSKIADQEAYSVCLLEDTYRDLLIQTFSQRGLPSMKKDFSISLLICLPELRNKLKPEYLQILEDSSVPEFTKNRIKRVLAL